MTQPPTTAADARAALELVERSRLRVVAEIGIPTWYWLFLAAGWIVLGVISDIGNGIVTTVATLLFGMVHSAIAPRVLDGRRRSGRLSVRADVAGREISRLVFGGLILLVLITIGAALLAAADGARHPATVASVFVAVLIVLGGPQLLAIVRRRAARGS